MGSVTPDRANPDLGVPPTPGKPAPKRKTMVKWCEAWRLGWDYKAKDPTVPLTFDKGVTRNLNPFQHIAAVYPSEETHRHELIFLQSDLNRMKGVVSIVILHLL